MHVRYSACHGTHIVDDGTDESVAQLQFPLLHPDLGTVEGFYVKIPHFLRSEVLFLSSVDIIHWGAHIRIRDADVLAPLEDRVRLQALVEEGRTILGQKMLSESGAYLGRCLDIQFNTKTFMLEWLFPRKLFRWGTAMPVSAIVEVKKEAVILRDLNLLQEVEEKAPILRSLEELAKAPTASMAEKVHGK